MVQLSIQVRPQRGYTYPKCIKQVEVDSSTRLEDVLASLKIDKREIFLYSPSGIEMPLNSSLASHNLQDGDIIETCSSPMISSVISAVLADLDSVKALPEEGRTRDVMERLLDATDNPYLLDMDYFADRWTTNHIERRIICLATMKKAIQRNDRFATKNVPAIHDLHSLLNFVKDNNIFATASNGHSTALQCFKPSAANRNGSPTICWELVQHKINKFMQVAIDGGTSGDLIEPFVRIECNRHGNIQNTPTRSNRNRSRNLFTRPQRNLFLTHSGSPDSRLKCQECSVGNVIDADSVCLVTSCPFYSKITCQRCFDQNHPLLSSRSHERTPLTDPTARAVLRQLDGSYCPEYASGPFAILGTLLEAQRNRQYFLNESDLKAKAQLRCRSNLYDAQRYGRSAFTCMDTLTRKNLVRKELVHGSDDAKYSLLPNGEALAAFCLEFDMAVDHVLRQSCPKQPWIDGVPSSVDILWDRREDKTLAARFQARCRACSIRCEERELPAGDYIFRRNDCILPLIVERKTWSDFADSVQGKGKERLRLQCLCEGIEISRGACSCQLCRMKRSRVGRILFVIEGGHCLNQENSLTDPCTCVHCKELRDRHGLSQDELERYIYRLQVDHQVLVHYTKDYNDTIMTIHLLREILSTVSTETHLTYDQFCSNIYSNVDTEPLKKRGKVMDLRDDELIKMLNMKEALLVECFEQKVTEASFTLGAFVHLSCPKSASSTSEVVNLGSSDDESVVDLTYSQSNPALIAGNKVDDDIIEILEDSFIPSAPPAKRMKRIDSSNRMQAVLEKVRPTVCLVIISGLYDYLSQYNHDIDRIWQSMSKSSSIVDFPSVAASKLKQVQMHRENIPLVQRQFLFSWILYVQLRFNVIIHSSRKTSCRDMLVNLWNENVSDVPLNKPANGECIICRENKLSKDSEFLPCMHSFHRKCIQQWWGKCKSVKKCPICNMDVVVLDKDSMTAHRPHSSLPPRHSTVQQRAASSLPQEIIYPLTDAAAATREARLRYFAQADATVHSSWICNTCTFANENDSEHCEMCDVSKYADSSRTKMDPFASESMRSTHPSPIWSNFGDGLGHSKPSPIIESYSDSKSKTCGACKGFGHNRSNYSADCCTAYFHESEVEYRRKKKEKIEQMKEEKVKQMNDEKVRADYRSETTKQILSLAAELQKTEECQKKASETIQKKLEREVQRLSKKLAN